MSIGISRLRMLYLYLPFPMSRDHPQLRKGAGNTHSEHVHGKRKLKHSVIAQKVITQKVYTFSELVLFILSLTCDGQHVISSTCYLHGFVS